MISKGIKKPSFLIIGREWIVCLFIVITVLAVYWQVGHHDFITYDDRAYVTDNPVVKSGLNLKSIKWAFTATHEHNWHPLTWLSHMLDCQIYGLNPRGHHFTSILFHIVNSILLFLIFRRMTKAIWESAFVAILFAIHPLHVESVAWVAERKDVLSTFFWMLTMGAYMLYVENPNVRRYLLAVLLFALGLMAKPMLVTLPFVLFLLDYWPLNRLQAKQCAVNNTLKEEAKTGKISQKSKIKKTVSSHEAQKLNFQWAAISRLIYEKIPFLLLSLISCILTVYAQQQLIQPLGAFPLSVRVGNALISYSHYLIHMIWPFKLALFYPHPITLSLWQVMASCIFLVAVSSLAIVTIQRFHYFAAGWFWYMGTLLPVIGIIQVATQAMDDRYTYIPLIGIFIVIAWGTGDIMQRWKYKYKQVMLALAGGIIVSILLITTWMQAGYWKNSVTLYQHALNVTTKNDLMHYNMGVVLFEQGEITEAIDHYTAAIAIDPYYVDAHLNLGDAWNKRGESDKAREHYAMVLNIEPQHLKAHLRLGNNFFEENKIEEAITHFSNAVKLDSGSAYGHIRLGDAFAASGQWDNAVKCYLEALAIEPDNASIYYNLGNVYYKSGNVEEAVEYYSKALIISPSLKEGHNNLGNALMRSGRIKEAIDHFRESLRIDPDFDVASINLKKALLVLQEIDASIINSENGLKIEPQNPKLYYNLGNSYFMKGDFDNAIKHFKNALSIDPNLVRALNNLSIIYMKMSRYGEAIEEFKKLVQRQPDFAEHYYNMACMYALQNKVEESIDWLRDSIKRGYDNWDLIKSDKQLKNINNSSDYRELLSGH